MPATLDPPAELAGSRLPGSTTETTTIAHSDMPPLSFDSSADLRLVLVPSNDTASDTITAPSERSPSALGVHEESSARKSQVAPGQHTPVHPIPTFQDAFAESLQEVTNGHIMPAKPKLRDFDARARREKLLEQGSDDDPFDALWRYRPGQEQHEVYKLIAQITFGVYLLLNGLAADNAQVVTILQGHIDEVDEFLEVLLEDFAQANEDLNDRISHLQLPMANRHAFENMLEDRNFRAQILAGNEKIDHILSRTNLVMKLWDDDIDAGLRSSEAFKEWLKEYKDKTWPEATPDLNKTYQAMQGNADGWLNAFDDLNAQAQELNGLVIKLMTIVAEIERTAGEVSRRTWANIQPFSLPVRPESHDYRNVAVRQSGMSSMSYDSRASFRSGESANTMQTLQPPPSFSTFNDTEINTLSDFPLPGGTPLLPPPRVTAPQKTPSPANSSRSSTPQPSPKGSHRESSILSQREESIYSQGNGSVATEREGSIASKKESIGSKQDESNVGHKEESSGSRPESKRNTVVDNGPLYILQPRTYTPQPPGSIASPKIPGSPAAGNRPPSNSQKKAGSPASATPTPAAAIPAAASPVAATPVAATPAVATRPPSHSQKIVMSPPLTTRPPSHSQKIAMSPPLTARPPSHSQKIVMSPPVATRPPSHSQKIPVRQVSMPPQQQSPPPKRSSLRQRVSQRGTPPDLISIPPRNAAEARPPSRPGTGRTAPIPFTAKSQALDSTYGSDTERLTAHRLPRSVSHAEFAPPLQPHLMASPRSEQQQFYHPVQASPHSPLQQRPHTAGGGGQGYFTGHTRQPSRMGAMSTLSSVTSATYDDGATMRSTTNTQAGGKRAKKKKGAFGWLKKAFSLDEDERAEFEARRAMQYQYQAYGTPKFIDGRRIR